MFPFNSEAVDWLFYVQLFIYGLSRFVLKMPMIEVRVPACVEHCVVMEHV